VEIPEITASQGEWKLYDARNRHVITTMMKSTPLRARTKWRREMKELKHKREEQRKNATTVKKLLQLCAEKARVRANQRCCTRKLTSKQKLLMERKIKAKEIEVTTIHMGECRRKWYIHNNKILPEFDNTIKGKTWRRFF
jgi:hypothetical protein